MNWGYVRAFAEFSVPYVKNTKEEFMKKNTVLKIVNPILGVLLVNQILMGLMHTMLPRKAFEVFHEGGGIIFAILAILHVILNWNWIKANFLRNEPKIKT
jgi:hypothetical protein